MVWKPIFWIAYNIHEFWELINGLIITNYNHGEPIYKFFMYYYIGGYTH